MYFREHSSTTWKMILLMLICSSSICIKAKTIIWDLGGVLFEANAFKLAYHEIGLSSILGHALIDGQHPRTLQQRLFEALYALDEQHGPNEYNITSNEGHSLPAIMCKWLTNEIHPQDIIEQALIALEKLHEENFFISIREKKLLTSVIHATFTPITMIRYIKTIKKTVRLLAECAQDPDCRLIVLSNWDAYSFAELYSSDHGQEVFQYFKPEHIIISGDCGIAKPDRKIFEFIINRFNLDPVECMFIDDQEDNIKIAHACGFNGIVFKKKSYKKIRAHLIKHGFLNPLYAS